MGIKLSDKCLRNKKHCIAISNMNLKSKIMAKFILKNVQIDSRQLDNNMEIGMPEEYGLKVTLDYISYGDSTRISNSQILDEIFEKISIIEENGSKPKKPKGRLTKY